MEKIETKFDFKDGNGPVPAINWPNGGGWVALTAKVDETVFVGQAAKIFGNAKVSGNVKVTGFARIFGNAWVSGDVFVFGNARIFGNASVFGYVRVSNGEISGNAKIFSSSN
jgi:carbonic anhydrase/acetyltransferase-like protein (isoleucine patch superfamily)